jgi:FlaA1/EpsC-like NDP-sugar epimerase
MFVRPNRLLISLGTIALLALSFTLAWLLRFNFSLPDAQVFLSAMPLLLVLRILAMARFNLTDVNWRVASIRDYLDIMKAVVLGSVGFLAAERGILGERRFPLAVYCIEMLLTLSILIAVRALVRPLLRRVQDSSDRKRGLGRLNNGTATVKQLREVKFEDLLGRVPVHLNVDSVRRRIAGRVVMVTGAAGSIGIELCRQLCNYQPLRLVCVDQAETPLFHLQNANSASSCDMAYCVADITDSARMRDIIREHDVRVIFHAAAYKHVPLMEENLQEALKNNIFGLFSLLEIADQSGCEDFLLISSDKAVHPSSFMGCTKRIGELMIAARPSRMRCLCVRFGNVLGSQGSVIPVFQEQIRLKRRITVTHPDVTRFFMTIPEAVSLMLQAFSVGEKSDILVLDMGKPVRILDLAKMLIHLSGIPQDEIEITFSGLRPGEKLFEKLFYSFEKRLCTEAPKVFRTQGQTVLWTRLLRHLAELRAESETGINDRIRSKVKEIVPEYLWVSKEEELEIPAPLLHETQVYCESAPLMSAND